MNLFARVGIPQEILTDQGTNFMSQLMMEIYSLLHIKSIRTTAYHPQTDGLVERFNKTLKAMLRKYATESGKEWDKLLHLHIERFHNPPQDSLHLNSSMEGQSGDHWMCCEKRGRQERKVKDLWCHMYSLCEND